MISMIWAVAKLCIVFAAVAAFLPSTPSYAADFVAFVSNVGSGTSCTAAQPCGNLTTAMELAENGAGQTATARVICLNPITSDENSSPGSPGPNTTLEVDCPLGFMPSLSFLNPNTVARFRGVTFTRTAFGAGIFGGASGTLIFEDCVFTDATSTALDIEPNGPLTLVIRNSRVSNNAAAGVLIKPASGGSVTATFDGVTITKNAGGLRTDTTNGPVRVDISNSTISNNADNGLIAIGGAGGMNMMTVKNGVIASNGQAGIEASGANAAVLVNNAVLDSNTLGALSAVSSGRILTYQNNAVIGSPGSGFTGVAAPQ